jgi:diguanylate cyclase (GGDEF)-like protein
MCPDQNSVANSTAAPEPSAKRTGDGAAGIKTSLRRLDRKDSWYWWNAVLVIMLLMGAIVVLSLPRLLQGNDDPAFQLQLALAVRGLLGLVLIFNVYTLYQQYLLRQLRHHLAGQIEIATEQRVRAEAFYEMAILDPLTGLYNRRYSEERLAAEIKRAERHGTPLIVIAFDLDHFKPINDHLGHSAGDLALREFAGRLNKAIRGSDFAVRTGGDEFLVVLPDCPPEKVQVVLSRLSPFEIDFDGKTISLTASHGWIQYQPPETLDHLIQRADTALYENKEAHRAAVLEDVKS